MTSIDNEGYYKQVNLYAKDKKGNIRTWIISANDFTIYISHGLVGGAKTCQDESIPYGKAGRTRREQMLLRLNRLIENKIDAGYVYDIEDANKTRTNAKGLLRPMLAQKFDEKKHSLDDCVAQTKLNGFRCLTVVYLKNLSFYSYTRKGREIKTIKHIHEDLNFLFTSRTLKYNSNCDVVILDGELYNHEANFQQISSWVKREQEDTKKLDYFLYDNIFPGISAPYIERFNFIDQLKYSKNIQVIENHYPKTIAQVNHLFNDFVTRGYEGLMLRKINSTYEDSVRSNNLLKVKSLIGSDDTYQFEEEFLVTKIEKTTKGVPVVHCATKEGIEFKVVCPGSHFEREKYYENRNELTNKHLTVQFSELTNKNKPFQPIAIKFRDISFD